MRSNQQKRAKTKEKNEKLIKFGILIITLIFIFIIYKIFNIVVLNNKKIDLSGDDYYQYFYGVRMEYSGELELVREDNNKQLVLEDGKTVHLDSTPIYYKNTLGKVLLPNKMEVIFPNKGTMYKTEEFSNVILDSKVMYAKRFKKDKTKSINNAFLYDGEDLYFFLEEVTVTIGKKKYKLSPLSYAIVNYRQNVELFDYDSDKYIILEDEKVEQSDVMVTNKNKDYKINMSVDSFSTKSTDQLIRKNIDSLQELDY